MSAPTEKKDSSSQETMHLIYKSHEKEAQ